MSLRKGMYSSFYSHSALSPMLASVGECIQLCQPQGIMDQCSIGWARSKGKKSLKHPANGCESRRNRVSGQKLALLILEAGIAELAGATAHDHDGLVPCALQLAQHHDGYQRADVQRRRSRIEADISRYNLLRR